MGSPKNTPERLRATWREKYAEVLGCHEWLGARHPQGYGTIRFEGSTQYAHRVAYQLFVGPIPEGLCVRHKVCDNPCCVNPAHLRLGTHADNMQDMVDGGRQNPATGSRSMPGRDWASLLRSLVRIGLTHKTLARKFGVHSDTIWRTIERHFPGGSRRPNTMDGPDWPIFLRKLKATGLTQGRLAKKFGVSPATLSRTINR